MEIKINLGNIKQAEKNINNYIRLYEKAFNDGMTEFYSALQDKLISNMIKYGINTPSILASIDISKTENGFIIRVQNEIAMYLEYGTGIVGSANPHPKLNGWIYDVNGHGESGWWYPTTMNDPNPYKWTDESGQLRAWTKGQISKPFMYDTWLWGQRSITNIVGKHLRRIK